MTRARETTQHRSFRLALSLCRDLVRHARESGESMNSLAERYIAEGLRMDEHPLIGFRDGVGGRRAALAGTRLDVWQVIDTLRNSRNSVEQAADYLDIPPNLVRAAARYYAAYEEDVHDFAERAQQIAEREEELWRGEQAVLA